MLNAVKSYLADSKVFRPEVLGRIDKVYVFQPLQGIILAEVALIKISNLAKEYGLEVQFVAPELIMQAILNNEKVSRFGIRELERIVFDMSAEHLTNARENGANKVAFDVGDDGAISIAHI